MSLVSQGPVEVVFLELVQLDAQYEEYRRGLLGILRVRGAALAELMAV